MLRILSLAFVFVFASSVAVSNSRSSTKRKAVVSSVHVIAQNPKLRSVQNRDIVVIRVPAMKKGKIIKAKHHFYLQGGLHGNEKLTTTFVAWVVDRLVKGQSALNKLPQDKVAFDFVPIANPDGVRSFSRNNANKINLNRNFGVLWGQSSENPGKSKFSEPETKAIRYLMKSQKYTAAVDVHGFINWVVAPSPAASVKTQKSLQAQNYTQWSRHLKQEMRMLGDDYILKNAAALGDGGAFEDWAFWKNGTFAFCLEMASAYRYQHNNKSGKSVKIDRFRAYENYIYTMFKHALKNV